MTLADFITAFTLGLLTPLTAVCVLPIYPAFLSYLANQFSQKASKITYALFGLIITLGVILFMFLLGLIFTTFFQISLTKVISIVSPIAFIILVLISLLLIFNIDFSRFIPQIKTPTSKHPLLSAFFYGFFFGAIVIPCNPAFIAIFFARAFLIENPILNLFNFISFGFGIGFPLLLFSLVSVQWSQKIIFFLASNKRIINFLAGMLMLVISLYYLIFVFRIFG